MRNWKWIALAAMVVTVPALADDRDMKFWNLTAETVNELFLAPAGSSDWSPNQCLNDVEDKTVEADERLALKGIPAGRYDVRIADVKGRKCLIRNVAVKSTGKYAFSIAEKDMKGCTPW
jgi:hypothetical protein